ncbi:MAG: ypjG [Bacillales bacterium]|jgi:bacillithiol biosynthesis deacetylase BshB1|nr:ypjG [Bacillales bacterium]
MLEELDVLCFGAHPDDVEIGMAGTISKMTENSLKVGIIDLTQAEMSSNGDVALRQTEASNAADILRISLRKNLFLKDRSLFVTEETVNLVVDVIRRYKPRVVFSPYFEDRHPDHGNCSKIIKEAVFSAGIKKWKANENRDAFRPSNHFYYIINGYQKPTFAVDISEHLDNKIKALEAYESQFFSNDKSISTPLTNNYINSIIARDTVIGNQLGVKYAEGFISETSLLMDLSIFGV